jgi:hypothetical protein
MARGPFLSLALGALCSTSSLAHHSIAGVYDSSRSITVEGVVTAFHFVNPHPFVEIDTSGADGRVLRWRLELDNLRELKAIGIGVETLAPGDALVVTGSRARDSSRAIYVRRLERSRDGFVYEQVGASPRIQRRPR